MQWNVFQNFKMKVQRSFLSLSLVSSMPVLRYFLVIGIYYQYYEQKLSSLRNPTQAESSLTIFYPVVISSVFLLFVVVSHLSLMKTNIGDTPMRPFCFIKYENS